MFSRIEAYIREKQMISPGDRVLAGVSGGADSVFLLCALKRLEATLGCKVSAVHVEHGIRGEESRADAAFTENLCSRLGVPLTIILVDAPAYAKEHRISLEEAARILRYEAFERIGEDADRIAVAHQLEDNAETMLFHLARGSGLAGLAGIPPVRGKIIRPLLCVSRKEIEQWLQEQGQCWRTDSTNTDVSYSRNRIRSAILPELETINPAAVRHMAETAELLRKAADYLQKEAECAREACVVKPKADRAQEACFKEADSAAGRENRGGEKIKASQELDVAAFRHLHPALQEQLILHLLKETAGSSRDISGVHIKSVIDLCEKQTGSRISLPYQMTARRTYTGIVLERSQREADTSAKKLATDQTEKKPPADQTEKKPPADQAEKELFADQAGNKKEACGTVLQIPGETVLPDGRILEAKILPFGGNVANLPRKTYTKWVDYGKINSDLLIRYRGEGDFLQINAAGGHKSLQDYMVNEKIPADKRDRIPLLAAGNHILWVIGYRISEFGKITEETEQVLALHIKGENT